MHYSDYFPRLLRVLSLATGVISLLFVQAMTYAVRNPDDGTCGQYETLESCLAPPSAFDSSESKCYWDPEQISCSFRSPDSSLTIMLYVAGIAACISAPIVIGADWIIMNLLAAPTANSNSVDIAEGEENEGDYEYENGSYRGLNLRPSEISEKKTVFDANMGFQTVAALKAFEENLAILSKGLESHRQSINEKERELFDSKYSLEIFEIFSCQLFYFHAN